MQSKSHMQKSFIPELLELQKSKNSIDAMHIAIEMKRILTNFQKEIYDSLMKDVQASLSLVLSVLPNNLNAMYNTHLESDDGKVKMPIGTEINYILHKISKVYPPFLEGYAFYE